MATAMITMEVLSTRREHVDVERRTIYIPHAKAGAREQPMTGEPAEFLEEYMKTLPRGTEWLFHRKALGAAIPWILQSPSGAS